MQINPCSRVRSSRFVALFVGAAIASATLFQAAPARADKAKTLKYGAIGLGVVGAYLYSKGKTVPAAAAAAGGYYAYKKSQDAKNQQRYGYYPGDGADYGSNGNYRSENAIYPDSDYDTQYRSNATMRGRDNRNREDRRQSRRNTRGGNFDLSPYIR